MQDDQQELPPDAELGRKERSLFNESKEDFIDALESLYIHGNTSGRLLFLRKWPYVANYLFGEELMFMDEQGDADRERKKELEEKATARQNELLDLLDKIDHKLVIFGSLQVEALKKTMNRMDYKIAELIFDPFYLEKYHEEAAQFKSGAETAAPEPESGAETGTPQGAAVEKTNEPGENDDGERDQAGPQKPTSKINPALLGAESPPEPVSPPPPIRSSQTSAEDQKITPSGTIGHQDHSLQGVHKPKNPNRVRSDQQDEDEENPYQWIDDGGDDEAMDRVQPISAGHDPINKDDGDVRDGGTQDTPPKIERLSPVFNAATGFTRAQAQGVTAVSPSSVSSSSVSSLSDSEVDTGAETDAPSSSARLGLRMVEAGNEGDEE